MTKNPFEYEAANNLRPEDIIDYYIEDFNFSRFIQSTKNIFLIGERGSGKTMALLYNSFPIKYAIGKKEGRVAISTAAAGTPSQTTVKTTPAKESTTIQSENAGGKQTSTSTANYVANKNTKKFHYPTCSSVDDMKEKMNSYHLKISLMKCMAHQLKVLVATLFAICNQVQDIRLNLAQFIY